MEIINNKIVPELSNEESSSYHGRIDAILHQIEIGFKRHKPDFGFGLLSSIVPSWVNGVDQLTPCKWKRYCRILKKIINKMV